jgi:uncharacterized membrane protein
MKTPTSYLLRLFVTGVLTALPLAATVFVFWWAISVLLTWVGPGSALGSLLRRIGLGVTGLEFVGYLIGLALVVVAMLLLGLLVERAIGRSLARAVDRLMRRIPLVRTVWDLARRMVGLLQQGEGQGVRSMTPVWCHFGGPGGAAALALLSNPQPVFVDGRACLAVIVPTAPIPVGGGLLFVPQEWVTRADLGAEALTSIYVSMGVSSSQYLGVAGHPAEPLPRNP